MAVKIHAVTNRSGAKHGIEYPLPRCTPVDSARSMRAAPPALRPDRLLQFRGDIVRESLDTLLVRAFDEDAHLGLRSAVADEDAAVLAELLLRLAHRPHHRRER